MGEILDKEEVEALLSAVSSGNVKKATEDILEKKSAVVYDFKRRTKISKDRIRTLELLHENFIRVYTVKLANYLRTMVELNIISVDQLTYAEFIASLSEPTYLAVLSAEPLPGQIILEIDPSLSFSIIDRLLGGSGTGSEEARELTEIEHSLMKEVVSLALSCLEQAWQRIIPLQLKMEVRESNPQFVHIAHPGEMAILVTMKSMVGESPGVMNICIPCATIEPILPKLSPYEWTSETRKQLPEKVGEFMKRNLEKTKIKITVELGTATINMRDFLQLKIGDVVLLEQRIKQDLVLKVEDFPKFRGSPGRLGKRKAIQITSKISSEEN